MSELTKKSFFNELGDTETSKKKIINGNTTNLNDFNNMKYIWASDWYRTAMNNFWIPEEINMSQDLKDYRLLSEKERTAYDKVLSFLIFKVIRMRFLKLSKFLKSHLELYGIVDTKQPLTK